MSHIIGIGEWRFSPKSGELSRGDVRKRLEKRASSLLELLCQRDGDLVSHAEIIEHVWEGRFVSPNSVAVVVADIRKALEDNAREPIYLETIPKRGYRLIAELQRDRPDETEPPVAIKAAAQSGLRKSMGKWTLIALAPIVALFIVGGILQLSITPADGATVSMVHVEGFINETNDEAHAALAISVSEVANMHVSRQRSLQVVPLDDSDIIISGNLIMWDGHVAVSLEAKDRGTNQTVWSGIASGPETKLPQQIRTEISSFADTVGEG